MEHLQIMYTISNFNRPEHFYLNSKDFVIKLQTTDKSSGVVIKRNLTFLTYDKEENEVR